MTYMNENPIIIKDQTISGELNIPSVLNNRSVIFSNCRISDIQFDGEAFLGKRIQNLTFHNCHIKNFHANKHVAEYVMFEDCHISGFVAEDCRVKNKLIVLNSKSENLTIMNTTIHEFQNIGSKYANVSNDDKCFFEIMSITKCVIAESTLYLDEKHIQTLIIMNSLFQQVFSGDLSNEFKFPVVDLCTMDYKIPSLVMVVNRKGGTVYNGMLPTGQELEEMYHGVMMDSVGMPFGEKLSAIKFVETILAINYLRDIKNLYLEISKIQAVT